MHTDIWGRSEMLTIAEAQQRTELFLTEQMTEALQAVEYELPSFETEAREVWLADAARSRVQIRHVRGASDATYLVNSFGDELLMQLQITVRRLVVVVPGAGIRCARREYARGPARTLAAGRHGCPV